MKTPCGAPRKLTDRQIIHVLKWHQEAIDFRHAHGTMRELAHVLGVSMHAVRGCFEMGVPLKGRQNPTPHSSSRAGRKRHLNRAQIAFALAWRSAGREFRARHGTVASVARTFGVGASTIHDCIRRKGRYIQRIHVEESDPVGQQSLKRSDESIRSELLRAWLRPPP